MIDGLPTDWITMQSLGTWAGMVSAILAVMAWFYLRWGDLAAVQDGGMSAAIIINLIDAALWRPTAIGVFLALLNGVATGVAAIVVFRTVVRPRLEKYRDQS